MEESLRELKKYFGITDGDPSAHSALSLAYIGDAVFELIVRYIVVSRMNAPVSRLHKISSHIVCAEAQSEMVSVIEEELTEEERHVYKRGRNAKSNTSAKNASITEYRRATGFEALMGYLFLKGDYGRLTELAEKSIMEKTAELA